LAQIALTTLRMDKRRRLAVHPLASTNNSRSLHANFSVLRRCPDGGVASNARLLHGAIENVVRNSLKHAPETRIVRVEAELDTTNAYYRLRVLDAGPGVAEEEFPRLLTSCFAPPPPRQKTDMGWGSLSHAVSSSCMAVRCRLPIAAVAASVSRSNFRYVKIAQRRDAYPLARNR